MRKQNAPVVNESPNYLPVHPTSKTTVFLLLLALWLYRLSQKPHREGDLFKSFMVGYMGFRLLVDFIKPGASFIGLTAIQWACFATLIYYARDFPFLLRLEEAKSL